MTDAPKFPLPDHTRATLLLYLLQVGDPRKLSAQWAGKTEVDLLMYVTGWHRARATAALDDSVSCGYATDSRRQAGA